MPAGDPARMPAERRRELVRVAAAEFAAGYDAASLNRIIRAVGMSKSSFYHVIESKQELFEFVVRELAAEVAAALPPPRPEEFRRDFWPRVDALLGDFGRAAAADPSLALLGRMFYLSGGPRDVAAEFFAAIERWLEEVLQVGRDTGAVRDDLPIDLQRRLLFAVLRTLDEWSVAHLDDLDSSEALLDAQLGTLRRILAP